MIHSSPDEGRNKKEDICLFQEDIPNSSLGQCLLSASQSQDSLSGSPT